jgi:putative hydrolase of the HAD superfamily
MKYKVIFFDFDDTLGDRQTYSYQTFAELIDTYCPIDDLIQREAVLQDCMLWDMRGNYNKQFIVENLKKRYGIELPIKNFLIWWSDRQSKLALPKENVYHVLEELRQEGYRLCILTNGYEKYQKRKTKNIHVDTLVDKVITSQMVGVKKPDPRIFQEALSQMKAQASEAVYVGDTFSNDIYGAYRTGIQPIWIRSLSWPGTAPVPRIEDLSELPAVIHGLEQGTIKKNV